MQPGEGHTCLYTTSAHIVHQMAQGHDYGAAVHIKSDKSGAALQHCILSGIDASYLPNS